MSGRDVLEERPISLVELKADIAQIKKRDKELNFRANKVEEYLNQFSKLDPKKCKELVAELHKLKIPRLKDLHIVKIVDIMPRDADDVKSVLQGYTITVSNDSVKKIVATVNKFA